MGRLMAQEAVPVYRLRGVLASHPVDAPLSPATGDRAFPPLAATGPDGWGIGRYAAGPVCPKTPMAARFPLHRRLAAETPFRNHRRRATCGGIGQTNGHPLCAGRRLFAHHGSVDRTALLPLRAASRRSGLTGESASALSCHRRWQTITRARSPESRRPRPARAVPVCVERLTEEPWQEIPVGTRGVVDADLARRFRVLNARGACQREGHE